MSYNIMHLLSKQLKPLLRTPNTLPVIQNCRDDYYVSVPFRTKDSIYYRNLVKTMGGRYDPISERWYIPNESFQLDDVKIIEDLRMYDGLKFKFSIQLPEFNPTLVMRTMEKLRQSTNHYSRWEGYALDFSKNKCVTFVYDSTRTSNCIIVNFYNQNFHNAVNSQSQQTTIIGRRILPVDYARDEWRYFASITPNEGVFRMDTRTITNMDGY